MTTLIVCSIALLFVLLVFFRLLISRCESNEEDLKKLEQDFREFEKELLRKHLEDFNK